MENALQWCSLLISLLAASVAVRCAVVCLRQASGSTSQAKRVREMETRVADLESLLDSMHQTLRRISAREGMRARRAAQSADAPPETKEAARAKYLHGRTHQEIALMAQRGVQ